MIFKLGTAKTGMGNAVRGMSRWATYVAGMHLDILAIPGPFHMQNDSST